jgi:hypothetical protein
VGLIFRPALACCSPEYCTGAGFTASPLAGDNHSLAGAPATARKLWEGRPRPDFRATAISTASARGRACVVVADSSVLQPRPPPCGGSYNSPDVVGGAPSPRFSHGQAGIKPSGLAASGHVDQFRHVGGAHLVHDMGTVNLHRARADAQIPCNLLAGEAGHRQRHALPLA